MTITMKARGILLAVHAIREQYGADAPVTCITETDEVWSIARERVEQARESGRMTIDGLPTWTDLDKMSASPVIARREPRTVYEGHWIAMCGLKARAIRPDPRADYTEARRKGVTPGVTWSEWVPVPPHFLADK